MPLGAYGRRTLWFCIVGKQLGPVSTRLMSDSIGSGTPESTGLERQTTPLESPLSQRFGNLKASPELIGADSDQLHITGFTKSDGTIRSNCTA